ncbi:MULTISPECIES: branched-chain amino acid ABC transporter permease [Marinobacter]|jgi:branched-chain amino acid transport system permease protein|uniref:Amino acid/amide ABC transporter membrane protein 2, HAAT family (TC 3.A.1.4.-) n=1 Tax=Marinobacter segnicrescens TaxID=430453 RepID=A0A1I0EQ12_9GAMM|nr:MULTISPECIES: branched-chain amino acid ABC transporter permease [Marinobacter]UZD65549.1 branched-chain amino acid ABC transporter permease [Marinobacter sp. AN1]SET47377.1 amino acid/amide ABC transporter membrane protein 2, HAAT family (TC 3.A.1.4.-) [Marinobacter segnicrescens]
MMFKLGALIMHPASKYALLALALLFPALAANEYQVYVMATAFIWAIAVYGFNVITGYCGQLNLAHGGFFAIGAYAVALLTADYGWNFWPAFIGALVITAVLGFLVGAVSLRLKEHYFAIFTLCVGFIIYLLLDKWEELTHGAIGVRGIAAPDGFGLVNFRETIPVYYLILFFLVFIIWFTSRIQKSLLGRTFIAIRNGDDLAESLGINLMKNKILAFVISTTYAGLAGALYAGMIRFVGPEDGNILHTFNMITYLLVGGIGTLFGPLIGTLGIVWITQSLQFLEEYRMIIFGPLLVILVIFFPLGVSGSFLTWMHRKAQALGLGPKKVQQESKVNTAREVENNA